MAPDDLPDELADVAAQRLLAVPAGERGPVLAALVAESPEHAAALVHLCRGLAGVDQLLAGTWPDATPALSHIGGHRVIRRLGEGAFGIVFLCAQEQPVVRQVAVKVLRPGAGDASTLRRFAAERQLLAQLNHPAITQVFDAGVLADGRPFFVMEYVAGTPFRRHCDDHLLSSGERLRLFIQLCHGVAHAHKRGIVHRDLKPGNVLVVDSDHGAVPKIIDFGVAKALFAIETGAGPRTDSGRVIGTPGYMSPEQAQGRTDEIDERADVFALGVMLYEVLTSALPWARGAAVSDTEPLRPSLRVTTSSAAGPATAGAQRQLAAALRGDLDWIILKALARERSERYQTVTELVLDVERHLRGEPVSVGPPSVIYRLRKFVRRNRTICATGAAAAVILGTGLFLMLAHGRSVDAAMSTVREDAAATEASAVAMAERLLARADDPRMRELPRSDAARQALMEDALAFYQRSLRQRPSDALLREGRCRALLSLSQVHWLLGDLGRAGETALEAGVELEALLAADAESVELHALLGDALRKQGRALAMGGNHAAARAKLLLAASELEICAARDPVRHGRAHAAVLREAATTIAAHLTGERVAAMRACLETFEGLRRKHPQIDGLAQDQCLVCIALAECLRLAGQLPEASAVLDSAAPLVTQIGSERYYFDFQILNQRASLNWDGNHRPEAIANMRGAIEVAAAWQAQQPLRQRPQEVMAHALRKLASFQSYTGAFSDTDASYREAIARWDAMREQFPGHANSLIQQCGTLREFARCLRDRYRREDLAEAKICAARATAVNELIPPEADISRQPRWQLLAMQAGIADSLGDAEAATLWQQVAAALPSDPQERARQDPQLFIEAFTGAARWHVDAGRPEAAADCLAVARTGIPAPTHILAKAMVEVGWLEARLAVARGDHAEAAKAAERIEAARGSWFGLRRAADCMDAAWHCAEGAGADAAVVQDYRDRAARLCERIDGQLRDQVAAKPDDPWLVLPWGFANLRRAELASDQQQARELLAAALPRLEGVRAMAHSDLWDEAAFQAAAALQRRLLIGQDR